MCVTDRHDMTLAVKVVLNPNTTNQPTCNSAPHRDILNLVLSELGALFFFQDKEEAFENTVVMEEHAGKRQYSSFSHNYVLTVHGL